MGDNSLPVGSSFATGWSTFGALIAITAGVGGIAVGLGWGGTVDGAGLDGALD